MRPADLAAWQDSRRGQGLNVKRRYERVFRARWERGQSAPPGLKSLRGGFPAKQPDAPDMERIAGWNEPVSTYSRV